MAILRCRRDFPQSAEPEQITNLRAFDEVEGMSLILDYRSEGELARHIDTILNRAVARESTLTRVAATEEPAGADVWPRIETSEEIKTDSKGRMRTSRRWELVLHNRGTEPARDVRYRLEAEHDGDQLPFDSEREDERRALEVLPPGGEARYVLHFHLGVTPQARCIVTWEDGAGPHENPATLRFF